MPGSEELSFKEMCARFDVTPRTLRYYEYIELLRPRKDGRSRFYSSREVARMTLILRGRRFGFSLEQIRQLLELYEPGQNNRAQISATIAAARDRLFDMERQYAELREAIADLRDQLGDAEQRLASMVDQPERQG